MEEESVINFGVRDLSNKEIMIGQSGLVLLDKMAWCSGVGKRECLIHMERKGYKKGRKGGEKEKCAENFREK